MPLGLIMKVFDQAPKDSEMRYNSDEGIVEVWRAGICLGRLLSENNRPLSFEDATAISIDMNPDDENCTDD